MLRGVGGQASYERRTMNRTVITFLFIVLTTYHGLAAEEDGTNRSFYVRLYGIAEQFEWAEYLDGSTLLEESGPLFGVGGELALLVAEPWWVKARSEVFFGEVDYDGAIQNSDDGTIIPYDSTTEYAGVQAEGILTRRCQLNSDVYIAPVCGLGLKMWTRILDTEMTDKYIGTYGYEENWFNLHAIIGGNGGIVLDDGVEMFATVEIIVPVYNEILVDLTNVGGPDDVELEPEGKTGFYVETGVNSGSVTVSIFYEAINFGESPLDKDYNSVFQPKSEARIIGLKAGMVF